MPYGITQYYLPPGRGDIPAFTPAEVFCNLVLLGLVLFQYRAKRLARKNISEITYFVSSGTLNLALSITVNLTLDFLMITTTAVHLLTTLWLLG